MSIAERFVQHARPFLEDRPALKAIAKGIDTSAARASHSIAASFPKVIRPKPRQLTIAITAHCNLRCIGCRYGRDFMLGEQLSVSEVCAALDDAFAAGVSTVRFYGGEPLVHPGLKEMVAHAQKLGLRSYITSNGILLKQKIDELYDAGLRLVTIGFYGFEVENTPYAQRSTYSESLERSLTYVRERYGQTIELQLNFVAMGPTCRNKVWRDAWKLAERYGMFLHVDLVSFSTPFFLSDKQAGIALTADDRSVLDEMVRDLLTYKDLVEDRVPHSREFIRSIPDWLLKQEAMCVPCDAYQNLWIGADGTVQLCDTALELGSIKKQRLSEIVFSDAHRRASRDAFLLNCPNCICNPESRIQKHAPSMRKYRGV